MSAPDVEMTDHGHKEIDGRWGHINKVLERSGPFAGPDFVPDTPEKPISRKKLREDWRILVIGAGGLGCEILKNLALSGFRNIDVIDMDTIDVSNLNRQFLFRRPDVGKPKSIVAADFIRNRIPGVNIAAHYENIMAKDEKFYKQFKIVIAGLDSIDARRWINSLLVELVERDDDGNIDPESIIPLIDGGTEGFKGQARVILPRLTACFECTLETFPPQVNYPMCTLTHTPRKPEHCIQWASIIAWSSQEIEKPFPRETKIDNDNPDHLMWLFQTAKTRADEHGIEGVTYKLTQGVVKNIIPAIASTNAIVAAACCNEAFKFCTNSSGFLNNYVLYNGLFGIYTNTIEYQQKETCAVCGTNTVDYEISPSTKLQEFLELLGEDARFQFKKPSARADGKNLYMAGFMHEQTKGNLEKTIAELGLVHGQNIYITDPSLRQVALKMTLNFI